MARDLGHLASHGYALHSIELFDFLTQTVHIESIAKLVHNQK
jgi:tRNA/tmRNA/rRNA uracil-C5-methylase (TrmA/RlmC/RlmD family)